MDKDTEYYFILGGDSLMNITSWRHPETICSLLEEKYHATILRLEIPTIEISSKFIRERCKRKEPIRYYVPETVFAYMNEHKLYV